MIRIKCKDCNLEFEVEDIDRNQKFIQCPICSSIKPNSLYNEK